MEIGGILFTKSYDGISAKVPLKKVPQLIDCLLRHRISFVKENLVPVMYEDETYSGIVNVQKITLHIVRLPEEIEREISEWSSTNDNEIA